MKNNAKGYRTVWDVVDTDIRDAHRAFARRFTNFVTNVEPAFPHSSAYGYVRGRSIRDNAARHCGRKLLLRCDIKDFFPSITRSRIENRFKMLGIQATVSELLSKFSTIEDKLALGLNASPMNPLFLFRMRSWESSVGIFQRATSRNCQYIVSSGFETNTGTLRT